MNDIPAIRREVAKEVLEEVRREIKEDLIATKKDLRGTRVAAFWAYVVWTVLFSGLWTIFLMKVTLAWIP